MNNEVKVTANIGLKCPIKCEASCVIFLMSKCSFKTIINFEFQ